MGGDNFNKANSDSESLLNAVKNAKNLRSSTDTRLREELQAQLEAEVAKYVNKLRLEEVIAKAAIKGKTEHRMVLDAHKNANLNDTAFVKKDATTGLTFAKSWFDFYNHIEESYKSDEIRIDILIQTAYKLELRIRWE